MYSNTSANYNTAIGAEALYDAAKRQIQMVIILRWVIMRGIRVPMILPLEIKTHYLVQAQQLQLQLEPIKQ